MTELRGEDYNPLLYSGVKFLLFFYRPNDAASSLQKDVLSEVDRLIPRPCGIYCVNADSETELKELFDIDSVPQIVLIDKQRKRGQWKGLQSYREIVRLITENK